MRLLPLLLVLVLAGCTGGLAPEQVQSTVVAAVGATVEAMPTPAAERVVETSVVTQVATVIVTATPMPVTATPRATATPEVEPTPSAYGKWTIHTEKSAFDDSTTVLLYVDAENDIEGPLGTFRPTLIARCQEGEPDVLIIVGMQPDVELGIDGATVRLRFDDTKPYEAVAIRSTANDTLFLPDVKDHIGALTNHDTLLFEFTPFNANPQEMTFDIRGFSYVVQTLLDECPL